MQIYIAFKFTNLDIYPQTKKIRFNSHTNFHNKGLSFNAIKNKNKFILSLLNILNLLMDKNQ